MIFILSNGAVAVFVNAPEPAPATVNNAKSDTPVDAELAAALVPDDTTVSCFVDDNDTADDTADDGGKGEAFLDASDDGFIKYFKVDQKHP